MQEPARKADAWIEEYINAETPGERRKVLDKFRAYVTLHPEDSLTRLKYINLLIRENDLEEALRQVEECLAYNPHSACILLKADLLNTMGYFDKVIEFVRRVKGYLNGEERMTIEITELLALINEGRYEEALSLYERIGKEKLLNYATQKPPEQHSILNIISELEAYEKGINWAQENQEVVKKAEEVFGRYFKVKHIIPKVEGDWEVPESPYLYIKVDEDLNTEKRILEFVERESKALLEYLKSVPASKVTVIIEPTSKKEELNAVFPG
jgi:tetratricopeptide (TPR) repeat protein